MSMTIVIVEDEPADMAELQGIVAGAFPLATIHAFGTLEEGINCICNGNLKPDRAILDMGICQDKNPRSAPEIRHGIDLLIHLVSVKGMSKGHILITTGHPESVEEKLSREEPKYRARVLSKSLYPAEYKRLIIKYLAED